MISTTEHEERERHAIVAGLLIPADWDEGGAITAIAVSTYSEEEYLIEPNPKGEELFAFVRQKVEIRGRVKMQGRGRKLITVKEYEILEE